MMLNSGDSRLVDHPEVKTLSVAEPLWRLDSLARSAIAEPGKGTSHEIDLRHASIVRRIKARAARSCAALRRAVHYPLSLPLHCNASWGQYTLSLRDNDHTRLPITAV